MNEMEGIHSPGGNIQFKLLYKSRLRYEVTFGNKPVIEESPIGISLDGINLAEDVEVGAVECCQVNETYPWRGVHSQAVNHCDGAKISLKHAESNTSYTLEIHGRTQ